MKLYRGYKTEPRFLTRDLEYELRDLQALFDEDQLPKESIQRFKELRETAQQYFSDSEQIAEGSAGQDGYVVKMEIKDEIALRHYCGTHTMSSGRNMQYSDNFVFSGTELASNLKNWKITIINLGKERERKMNLPKIPLR